MYLTKIEISSIKSFEAFKWELNKDEDPAGWHVLLGKNGAGKSSFIRAAAIALMGPNEALKSRADFSGWIKLGKKTGSIKLRAKQDRNVDLWAQKGKQRQTDLSWTIQIDPDGIPTCTTNKTNLDRTLWSGKSGWFSASYGPFRRFTGGSSDYQKLFYSAPLLARHISIFGEDVALTETLEWVKELKFKQLEQPGSPSAVLLESITKFINQDDFLPSGVKMSSVSSEGILFTDAFRTEVNIEDLSDGFRSVLSMMLELIRQMHECYCDQQLFDPDCKTITMPGVVFIDEVDVHLHASWQRKIGLWLTKHFPRIQFIVSTHSALICQSAEHGSIWKLPSADDSETSGRIEGLAFKRLVFGNIIEALSSGAFGSGIERSSRAKELLDELSQLNILEFEADLTEEQECRKDELAEIFAVKSIL